MTDTDRRIILCSCEDTMTLAPDVVRRGCPGRTLTTARQLCGAEQDRLRSLAAGGHLTVACTNQQPLFEEIAETAGLGANLTFVNVRETAGWSTESVTSAPKMAALLAMAEHKQEPVAAVTFESEGVTLIYGRDQRAIEAAERLKDSLDITVILLPGADVVPPRQAEYPIRQGRVRTVTGYLGAFEIMLDQFAAPSPSSRAKLSFGTPRNGALAKSDILIDLNR